MSTSEQLAQGIRAFEEFLNDRRDAPVSEVFHDVVAKVSELVAAYEAEKAQAGPVASPVLVRDVVDMLGTTVRAVSAAFVAMGHAPRSTNMAVTGEEAVQVAAHLRAAHAAHAAGTQGEPVAARYDFDGYGYQYIDNGSGSDWQTRIPDAEMLYTESDEAEIRADERERCAKLCEFEASKCDSPKLANLLTNDGRQIKKAQGVGAMNCANAIRRIGKEGGQG